MRFLILRVYPPVQLNQKGAILALQEICGLSEGYAKKMVKAIIMGNQRTVRIPDSADGDDIKRLGSYMEMSKQLDQAQPHGDPTVQLKLWEVAFVRRGHGATDSALVLAATKERAEFAITETVQTFGLVTAFEVHPPFNNGRILTTTITSI